MDSRRWSAQLNASLDDGLISESFFVQSSSALEREQGAVQEWPFAQESAFGVSDATKVLGKDLFEARSVDLMLKEGEEWLYKLYPLRSISRVIPLNVDDDEKGEVYTSAFNVLLPRVKEIMELMVFVQAMTKKTCEMVTYLLTVQQQKRTLPKTLLMRLIALVDLAMLIETLKEAKPQLQNDFSMYNRVVGSLQKSGKKLEQAIPEADTTEIHLFLTMTATVFNSLRKSLVSTPGDFTDIFQQLFAFAVNEVETERYVFPEDKFRYLRFLPFCFLFIDSSEPSMTGKVTNAFKIKRLTDKSVKTLFRRYPVVPLFADMHMPLINVLDRCPNFRAMVGNDDTVRLEWGSTVPVAFDAPDKAKLDQLNDEKLREDRRNYNLTNFWRDVRVSYDDYSARLQALAGRVKVRPEDVSLDKEIYDIVLEGVKLISKWKELIMSQLAFKYSRGVDTTDSNVLIYDRLVRLNYSKLELKVLFDIVAALKSLGSLLSQHSRIFFGLAIRRHIHREIQEFGLEKLMRICHSIYKKKKLGSTLALLVQLRALCVDHPNFNSGDFKEKKVNESLYQGSRVTRAVGPTPVQLAVVRGIIETIKDPDEKQEGLIEGFIEGLASLIISGSDLDKGHLDVIKEFYQKTFYFPYMLALEGTVLKDLSDLSFILLRDYYLDMCQQAQFPLSSSLAWLCVEDVITDQDSHSFLDSSLLFLDVYNDAAMFALKKLKSRVHFDEIEAEAKLVFEQFAFLVSDSIYTHYKTLNALRIMDKGYRQRLQELRRAKLSSNNNAKAPFSFFAHKENKKMDKYLEMEHKRFLALTQSTHAFCFVGRVIDLPKIICDQLNAYAQADLEIVLLRFEDTGLTYSIELLKMLQCVRGTIEDLQRVEGLQLDPFGMQLEQVDERLTKFNPKSRLGRFFEKELLFEIVPKFSYNSITERFLVPGEYNRGKSKMQLVKGSIREAITKASALDADFFSVYHLDAFLSAASLGSSLPHALQSLLVASFTESLVEKARQCLKDLAELYSKYALKLEKVSPGFENKWFLSGVQAMKEFGAGVLTVVLHNEERTQTLQLLREFGNILCVIRMLHQGLERAEMNAFIQTSAVTGLDMFVPAGPDQIAPPSVEACLGSPAAKSLYETLGTAEEAERFKDHITLTNELYRQPGLVRNAYTQLANMVQTQFAETKEAFLRVSNFIQFSYAASAGGSATSVPTVTDAETQLGEGVIWAIHFCLFALKSLSKFEAVDLCSKVARADALERCTRSDESPSREPEGSSNLIPFLACVRETIEPVKALALTYLSNVLIGTETDFEFGNGQPLQGKVKKLVTLFHPLGTNYDEATGEVTYVREAVRPQQAIAPPSVRRSSADHRAAPPPPAEVPKRSGSMGNVLGAASGLGPAPPPPVRNNVPAAIERRSSIRAAPPPPPPQNPGPAPPPPPRDHAPFASNNSRTEVRGPPPPPPPRNDRPGV